MYHRPHWSFSSISQYLRCPLQYFFDRVLGLPRPSIGSGLVLGSAVHSALETFHQGLMENRTTGREELLRRFKEAFETREREGKVTYKARETRANAIDQGVALVELYLEEPPPENIVAVERRFITPVRNSRGEFLETPLVAIADLIVEGEDCLRVNEFKTSGRAYSEFDAETSLQPTCYVNAVQEVYERPAEVEFTVLVKTKTPKLQRLNANRTEVDLGRLGDVIETVERAIRTEAFYPVESPMNCSTCPFRGPCRDWGRRPVTNEITAHAPTAIGAA